MIRKLRRKFVLTAMGSLLIILVLLLGFINAGNYIQVERRAGTMLSILLDHDGTFPQERPAETAPQTEERREPIGPPGNFEWNHQVEAPFETRYFSVVIADDGTAAETNVEHIAAVTSAQADSYAAEVVSGGQTRGHLGPYLYGTKTMGDGATLAVFVDRSSGLAAAADLMRSTLLIGAAALALMFLLVWLLSGMAVRPVVESLEKQKQFISDAGHELKTPLAVIKANTQVQEMMNGKDEWSESTMHQVDRMTGLIQSGKDVPIGYIPAGSTNDFANSLGIPKDMTKSAAVAVGDHPFPCDIGDFNSDTFVYVAAFGLFTEVSYKTSQQLKNIFGHVAYIMEGAKCLHDIPSYNMQVEYDGNVFQDEFIYGMVTNSISVGGFKGMTGNDVKLDDGVFEVTMIKKPRNPIELNEILACLANMIDDTDLIYSFKTDQVRITAKENVAWTLDGEFGGEHEEVLIQNLHQRVTIFC